MTQARAQRVFFAAAVLSAALWAAAVHCERGAEPRRCGSDLGADLTPRAANGAVAYGDVCRRLLAIVLDLPVPNRTRVRGF